VLEVLSSEPDRDHENNHDGDPGEALVPKMPLLMFIPYGSFSETDQPMKNLPAAEGDKKGYDGDDDNPYANSEP
jgi:hypothetical protein